MVKLIFDTRESNHGKFGRAAGLIEEFKRLSANVVPFDIEPLDEGDVKLISPTRYVVIERKTINDMHASKRDGRYYNQLDRLTKLRDEPRGDGRTVIILFILEKHPAGTKVRMTPNQYAGVKTSFNLKYNIPFIETASTADTAGYVMQLYKKLVMLEKNIIKSDGKPVATLEVMSAVGEGKSRKKNTFLDPKAFLIGTLSSIPSFGPKTILKMAPSFNSFPQLCAQIAERSARGESVETWLRGFGLNKRHIANLIKFTSP